MEENNSSVSEANTIQSIPARESRIDSIFSLQTQDPNEIFSPKSSFKSVGLDSSTIRKIYSQEYSVRSKSSGKQSCCIQCRIF